LSGRFFAVVAKQSGYDPLKAQVRLNWGSAERPKISAADLISAADKGLIRADEFRKNAVKILGWELWEANLQSKSNERGGE